jgi:hypothetical protein
MLEPYLTRCFFAAFAPSLPRAVRVFFGKCAIVRFRFAAAAAFFMFLRVAARCLALTICRRIERARRDREEAQLQFARVQQF